MSAESRSAIRWIVTETSATVANPGGEIHVLSTDTAHLLEIYCSCRPDVYEPGQSPVFPWDDGSPQAPLRRRLVVHRLLH